MINPDEDGAALQGAQDLVDAAFGGDVEVEIRVIDDEG